MQELIKALIKARGEFAPIHKDRINPHFKHKYATLDAVLDAVTPALGKYGLALVQTTAIESGKTILQTHLYHESGECIISIYPLPDIGDSQKFGAALTYARRYALCAILCVTADEDDDANLTTSQPKKLVNARIPIATTSAKSAGESTLPGELCVQNEVWRHWKSPEDAINWAVAQLPSHSPEYLQQEFTSLEASNGKKAVAWVKRVQELKSEF